MRVLGRDGVLSVDELSTFGHDVVGTLVRVCRLCRSEELEEDLSGIAEEGVWEVVLGLPVCLGFGRVGG